MVDLSLAIEELTTWNAGRVVVLEGAKGDFCSGADLSFVQQVGVIKLCGTNVSSRSLTLMMDT